MIYTITIVISLLVVINFILLKFSCNKTTKKISERKDQALTLKSEKKKPTKKPAAVQLAPTGS